MFFILQTDRRSTQNYSSEPHKTCLLGEDLSDYLISEIDLGRCNTPLFGLLKKKKNFQNFGFLKQQHLTSDTDWYMTYTADLVTTLVFTAEMAAKIEYMYHKYTH